MKACHAAIASAAAAHGQRSANVVTVPTFRVANVSRVTIPKLPAPPPRRA
jgi:aromatic ring hydroxylase